MVGETNDFWADSPPNFLAMCMHIAEKLGVEGAKKHGLTDRMEFRKKSIERVPYVREWKFQAWEIDVGDFEAWEQGHLNASEAEKRNGGI